MLNDTPISAAEINNLIRDAHNTSSPKASGLRIGIIKDNNVASFSVRLSMREAFKNARLSDLNADGDKQDFKDRLKHLDILILPGVSNETCSYYQFLMQQRDVLYDAVHNDGLNLLCICAGKYILYDEVNYRGSNGKIKKQQGLGFIKGSSDGPVDRPNAPHQPTHSRFDQTRVLRITYNMLSGETVQTGVCYGDGPAGMPAMGEDMDVIGRYADIDGTPAAIGIKAIGNGLVIATGVLPEISIKHMILEPNHEHLYPMIRDLRKAMTPHESGRQRVMDDIVQRFKTHIDRRKTI